MIYSDELLVTIRERLDYEAIFGEFVELTGRGRERMALCVFHENTHTPSMSINTDDGLYLCHNPECGAKGNVFDFYRRVRSLSFVEAVAELARKVGIDVPDPSAYDAPKLTMPDDFAAREEALLARYEAGQISKPVEQPKPKVITGDKAPIDEKVIVNAQARLMKDESHVAFLTGMRGLSLETIKTYQLGHDGKRYYIPVRDLAGDCVNIRQYRPGGKSASKMISWMSGYGTARLFPIQALTDAEPVYLMEGEMDCLLARQHGLNALTTTGGAGTWKEEWNGSFADRDVVICYDVDNSGRSGASHIALQLVETAKTVKVVKLPLTEPDGADFTDFIVGHGMTVKDFGLLVEQTPVFQRGMAVAGADRLAQEPIELHLSHASEAQYYNRPVKMNVMVSGKLSAPYLVPHIVQAGGCGLPGLKMCERCPVDRSQGLITKTIEFETNDILQFVDVPDQQLQAALKRKLGVPTKCGLVKLESIKSMNVELVQLIPQIARTDQETPYVTRAAFYLGHGLQANQEYLVTGITVPEPKKQMATHLLHTAVPSQSNIDAFRLTPQVVERLRVFSPTERGVAGLERHIATIYEDLEKVTRIYERRDIMLATDLMFHSILSFSFQGDLLQRGWIEALIIGDSRTGKTTIVQRLFEHYNAGEFGSGENTSLAGLVGGLHQIGSSWALQWGRIPLNDRRAFAIDEASNIPTDQISRMSSMRSSGVAEITKIHTERTNARTRQVWISNPRGNRPLSSYSQGVLAVKELIGAPEDIARFDLVVSVASGDVALAVVNAARGHESPDTFSRELCHQRVMWAWSRKAGDVEWGEGTVETVLRIAGEHGKQYRYAMEIPLVEPNEQRIKLARLGAATAAMFFSTDATGQKVIILPEHIEFAAAFLQQLYSKKSMSFDEYARQATRRYELIRVSEIEKIISRNPAAAELLMEQEMMSQRDLQEILSFDDLKETRIGCSKLREYGFFRRQGTSGYLKTPAAIRWLRDQLNGTPESNGNGAHAPQAVRLHEDLPDEPDW